MTDFEDVIGHQLTQALSATPLADCSYTFDFTRSVVVFGTTTVTAVLSWVDNATREQDPRMQELTRDLAGTERLADLPVDRMVTQMVLVSAELAGFPGLVSSVDPGTGRVWLRDLPMTELLGCGLTDTDAGPDDVSPDADPDLSAASGVWRTGEAPGTSEQGVRVRTGGEQAGDCDDVDTLIDGVQEHLRAMAVTDPADRVHEVRLVLDRLAAGDLSEAQALRLIGHWVAWTAPPSDPAWDDDTPS